jgi:hypothetical protein
MHAPMMMRSEAKQDSTVGIEICSPTRPVDPNKNAEERGGSRNNIFNLAIVSINEKQLCVSAYLLLAFLFTEQ